MILHLDLDCFFAAAHRINTPNLENIPIAVGGRSNLSIFDNNKQQKQLSKIEGSFTSSLLSSNNKTFKEYFIDDDGRIRGIITTASYEARAYGVKTAMSVSEALRICPKLVVLPPDYPLYHRLSYELKELLQNEIAIIEQFSIDEFFGDVSGWIKDDDVVEFAKKLQSKIKKEIGLPISIGIAKTKWIAKLATNDAKPYGIKIVHPKRVQEYIKDKPIGDFCGIGGGYQAKLHKYGIKTLGDIKEHKELFYSFGISGVQLYNRVNGTDKEELSIKKSAKKSIGLSRTFDPVGNRAEIKRRIMILCRNICFLAFKNNYNPMTFALKINYKYGDKSKDFVNTNRSFTEALLKKETINLFEKIDTHLSQEIVKIGIILSSFEKNKQITTNLFTHKEDIKQTKLTKSMQKIREKFGVDIVKSAGEIK